MMYRLIGLCKEELSVCLSEKVSETRSEDIIMLWGKEHVLGDSMALTLTLGVLGMEDFWVEMVVLEKFKVLDLRIYKLTKGNPSLVTSLEIEIEDDRWEDIMNDGKQSVL